MMKQKGLIQILSVILFLIPVVAFSDVWSPMTSGTTNTLYAIWGSSPSDVFAVGSGGTILHYDGNTWSPMTSGTTSSLKDIWGSSGSNVYVIKGFASQSILHYDGNAWSSVSHPININDGIWGSSPTDIFIVGWAPGNPYSCCDYFSNLHYNGSQWSYCGPYGYGYFYGIWGSSSNDVFIVGYYDDYDTSAIFHYNGSIWSFMPSGVKIYLQEVWGSSGTDVFAVGYSGTIMHYNGTAWSPMTSGTMNTLNGVWGSSGSDVFAVGSNGTILHYGEPTLITISSFAASPSSDKIILEWATASEIDNAGFNLYRAEAENGEYVKINDSLIPAMGSPTQGALYQFIDENVRNRRIYFYKLEDIDLNGTSTMHGPVSAVPSRLGSE